MVGLRRLDGIGRKTVLCRIEYKDVILFNPSNAKVTFVQSTRTQRFFVNHLNPDMLEFIG